MESKENPIKTKSIAIQIMKEVYRIKLMQPHLMNYSTEELVLIAVNGLRLDLEAAMQIKVLSHEM